jgi:hypothetical protein
MRQVVRRQHLRILLRRERWFKMADSTILKMAVLPM